MKRWLLLSTFMISVFCSAQNRIKSIYFENDQSIPTPYSQNQLQLFKTSFDKKEFVIREIYAYTDSVGSRVYNDSLARKRLMYVSQFLNIPKNTSIKLMPYGLDRRYDVVNAKSWRRVDIYFTLGNSYDSLSTYEIDSTYILMEDEFIAEYNDSIYRETKINPTDLSVPFILNVEFFEGTSHMDVKSQGEVRKFYNYLKENPTVTGTIRGHVCCGKNKRISKQRAKTVYNELIKMGIDKKRLDYKGMSNTEPLVFPEQTNADRQRNRRVDVQLKRN